MASSLGRSSSSPPLTVSVPADKLNNLKQTDKLPISKPKVLAATEKPSKQERRQSSTLAPTTAGRRPRPLPAQVSTRTFAEALLSVCPASRQESWEDSELFKPQPSSDLDALGKKRYVGRWRHRRAAPKC